MADRNRLENRGAGLGNRLAPPRFLLFGAVAIAAGVMASIWAGWQHGALAGFDLGAIVFLISILPLLKDADANQMRRYAAQNDANRTALLVMAAGVMLVILVVVAVELRQRGGLSPLTIGLIVGTLLISWLFTNTVFSLHYAHMYYMLDSKKKGDRRGIDFPETPEPDYWDFVYFSFCLGMTFQTSDSNITAGAFRRVVTLQCLMAFVFSIGVIAFSINVLGSAGSH